MGLLVVVVLIGISAGMVYFAGFELWVMVALGVLWLAGLVLAVLRGHRGFGSGVNTDLQIVLAGAVLTGAVLFPNYNEQKPCGQVKTTLRKVIDAEKEYFARKKAFTADVGLLNIALRPKLEVRIVAGEKGSVVVSVLHASCDDNGDGKPDIVTWDSARDG
jgi:hypothetical protein